MATTFSTCPSCSKKYARIGGEEARKPVVLTCLCVFCKACALQEEAKAQQQQPASGGGGKKGKGKKKKKKGEEEKEEYIPTPCMSCGKHCKVPVNELKLDVAAMKEVDGGATREPTAPVCDMCEEEQATTFCGDCKSQQLLCDGCYTFAHKSAKKQGHASILIQEHLAAAPARAAGRGSGAAGSAPPPMCQVHTDQPLQVYCNTCNILVCAMCAVMHHNGHDFTPVEQAIGKHRASIEALLADVVVTRQDAIAATNAIKIIRGELEGNRDAAIKLIDAGFTKLLRAIKQRRDALKQMVNDAYTEKDDVLNKQITELEGIESHSEIALKLVEATLAAATPVELLERKQLLVDGLTQFKEHRVSLKENCVSNMTIQLKQSFEQSANNILAIGMLDASATDPSASTAAGEGLAVAKVGEAAEFIVTAVDVGTGKQRSIGGDSVLVVLRQAITADEGAAPSGSGGGGGGGGGAAAAAKPGNGKRKRGDGGGGSSGKGRVKKSKTGATTPAAARDTTELTVVDNGDGTYSCSYTPSDGAAEVGDGKWQLEVLLNGKPIVGSPFVIEVRPSVNITNWAFGSIAAGEYALSEGGAVATKIATESETAAIADGGGCSPMTSGVHFWEFEVVKNDGGHDGDNGYWGFGVCRPGIDLHDGAAFEDRDDTWMVFQNNYPDWFLECSTCAGTGITLDPEPNLPDGSRIGLLLDLDNGGTLTMYWEGKPCGTIAGGLVGPLLPCIRSHFAGKVIKIHGGLAPPPK
eukprot:gene5158-biopygen22795